MLYFIKHILIENRYLRFSFNEIYSLEGMRYYISVVGADHKVYHFNMKELLGSWKLIHPEECPNWIVLNEDLFSTVIIEEQRL